MSVPSFDQWKEVLGVEGWPVSDGDGFALMVVQNGPSTGLEGVANLAEWSIRHGLFAMSAWGDDCERVHDMFDKQDIDMGLVAFPEGGLRPVVMTAWHSSESLPDALDFFFDCSIADEGKPIGPFGWSWSSATSRSSTPSENGQRSIKKGDLKPQDLSVECRARTAPCGRPT